MNTPRLLILAGIVLVLTGLAWAVVGPWLAKLGRLPGDIVIRREGFAFYFPIATCIVLSAGATFILCLMRR